MTDSVESPIAKDWIVFADGRFARLSEVKFFANTQALNYGTGVFEGIRAYWSADRQQLHMFRGDDHYDRFIASARTLRMVPELSRDALVDVTRELLRLNDFRQDVYVRPLMVKRSLMPGERFGVKLCGVDATLCITALPMGAYAPLDRFRCIVSRWRRVSDSAIPSGAKITGTYVNSALAYEDARDRGADDAIMLNEHGQCAEATTSNVFMVKDGRVFTPPTAAGILNGITRASVIDICASLGIHCAERTMTLSDLYQADQCFLTGTGIEIKILSSLDDIEYVNKSLSIAQRIADLYREIVRGGSERFVSWLMPVY